MEWFLFLKYIISHVNWISFLTLIVASVTAYVIYRQVKATEEQAKITKEIERNQRIPVVEVYMKYDQTSSKIYFEYFNFSNIPAFVSINVDFKLAGGGTDRRFAGHYDENGKEMPYRIGAMVKTNTSADFFYKDDEKNGREKNQYIHTNKTEATLKITVQNALSTNPDLKTTYEKRYKFHHEKDVIRWNEESWGCSEIDPREITTELKNIANAIKQNKSS